MDIGKGIQESLDLYTKNFTTLFVAGLVATLLSAVTLGILAGPLFGGFIILCLKLLKGEPGEFNEIFAHFDKFGPTFIIFLLSLVFYIICMIPVLGWLVGIVLGPVVAFIYAFAITLIIQQDLQPMDAVKKGLEFFQTNTVMNWVYVLVISILGGIGAIACGIGIILTLPFTWIGLALAYRELAAK